MSTIELSYVFSTTVYHYSVSPEMSGWTMVSLPKELAATIRNDFKDREEGWGRLKINAKIGHSQWQTAIWFDTKQETYLLPLKAAIRKKEKITEGQVVEVTIGI